MLNPSMLLTAALALTLTMASLAAQDAAPANPLDAAPPGVVMHDTLLAAHVDLSHIDVPALTAALPGLPVQTVVPLANGLLQKLREAGAEHVYITVPGRALLQGGVCVIIPCRDKQVVHELLADFIESSPQPFKFRIVQTDRSVIVCPEIMEEFFQTAKADAPAAERAEITAAFQSMAAFPHQAVAALPADLHQELAAVLPAELGAQDPTGFSPQRWLASMRTLAIGLRLPPRAEVELRMHCHSAEAAVACEQELAKLLPLLPPPVPRPSLSIDGDSVVVKLAPEKLLAIFAAAVAPARADAYRSQAMNNAKQLALALHNFHEAYQFIPGKYTADQEGRPLLSWRVALLPYLEQAPLYKKFHLDEPWDSAHNRTLIESMPDLFATPGETLPPGFTRFRLPVMEGSAWFGEGPPRTFKDITDGLSNTIWLASAPPAAAVAWTKPDDWQLDEAQLKERFFGDQSTAIVSFLDGSVHVLTPAIDSEALKALLTIAGGEVVSPDEIK